MKDLSLTSFKMTQKKLKKYNLIKVSLSTLNKLTMLLVILKSEAIKCWAAFSID